MEGKEVYIPQTITVHLGSPHDSSAQNVTVSYVDYIKNVTSSEIYSTWPENAILANMYCIISLSLNRIYTEWYRAKGYNFDITNNTAYDQYFVYGRNIFENISQLADEHFTTYARRKGRQNPYYTEYCNGSTVTCPGLKQWGTVDLANQGMTPLEILRYYYPKDIELVTTDNIHGITESYPGTPLRLGSQGDSVRLMQRYLDRIRVNFPLIPVIYNPNGNFDQETENAVKVFQEINNMTKDGIVGRGTWYKIVAIFDSVTKLAELGSEGWHSGIDDTPPDVVLKLGDRNSNVVQLQYIISSLAPYYDSIHSIIIDSYFGQLTRSAVISVQKTFTLPADGICGPATWDILYKAYNGIKTNSIIPGSEDKPTPNTNQPELNDTLEIGSRGDNVLTAQRYLNALRFTYDGLTQLDEDGIFGRATENNVKQFQKLFGLEQTGKIDPITWANLVKAYNDNINNSSNTPNDNTPTFTDTLYIGSRGEVVRAAQQYLNALHNVYNSIDIIDADGIYGRATANDVRAFQSIFGLDETGNIDSTTWSRLVKAYNDYINSSDSPNDNTPTFTDTLYIGSRGEVVRAAQQYLNALSNIFPSINTIDVDGIYGKATANDVKAFQSIFGLDETGNIDSTTWTNLIKAHNNYLNNDNIPTFTDTLYIGSRGEVVRAAQQYLSALHNVYPSIDVIDADGIYGRATANDVRAFQSIFGLDETGNIDSITWSRLVKAYNDL